MSFSFSEWKEVKLGEVCDIVMGQSPKGENCNNGGRGTPLLNGPTEFGSFHPHAIQFTTEIKKQSINGDLLFCVRGSTTGRMNWADKEYAIGRGLASIRHKRGTDYNHFVKALIEYKLDEILNSATGSTFPNVGKDLLNSLLVNIPPLPEQKAISATLSSLDDKIELNNRINKTLEEMAQAIFKSWYVDFEPFQDAEFEDSELGMIPKGWRVVELSEISTVQNGYAFKSTDYQENGCNMIRTTNFGSDGFVDNKDLIHLPPSFLEDSKYMNFRFNNLDTVLVMVGASVGKIGLITEKNIPALQNQNMWRFRPIHEVTSPIYIHYYVRLINERVRNWSSGSARDFYRKDSFQKAKCIYPTDDVMDSFQETIQGIFNKISLNLKESEALTTIRDLLIPKLMSGEIRVPIEEVN